MKHQLNPPEHHIRVLILGIGKTAPTILTANIDGEDCWLVDTGDFSPCTFWTRPAQLPYLATAKAEEK